MDEKIRELEREALAGNPEATEALLHEQRRMGLVGYQDFSIVLSRLLAGYKETTLVHKLLFNFEVHYMTSSSPALRLKITDVLGDWSNGKIISGCYPNKYELFHPRFLPKDSLISIEVENTCDNYQEIAIVFHGVKTNINNP